MVKCCLHSFTIHKRVSNVQLSRTSVIIFVPRHKLNIHPKTPTFCSCSEVSRSVDFFSTSSLVLTSCSRTASLVRSWWMTYGQQTGNGVSTGNNMADSGQRTFKNSSFDWIISNFIKKYVPEGLTYNKSILFSWGNGLIPSGNKPSS